MTTIFTQNGPWLSFWVKRGVILWICSALQAVISISAWEKSRDSTPRIFFLEHKMRPLMSLRPLWILDLTLLWKISIYQFSALFFLVKSQLFGIKFLSWFPLLLVLPNTYYLWSPLSAKNSPFNYVLASAEDCTVFHASESFATKRFSPLTFKNWQKQDFNQFKFYIW